MIVLGVILLLLGLFLHVGLLWVAGIVLLVVGLALLLFGGAHPVGGRRHWY